MKTSVTTLLLSVGFILSAQSAVVSVDVGISPLSYAAKTLDLDADGTTDFTFSGNGGICTTDVPTSLCVFAVTIEGRQGVEFLFDSSIAAVPRPLLGGDILGSETHAGVWRSTAYFSQTISSMMYRMDTEPSRNGYAEELDGIDIYSIGFRSNAEGTDTRYGWINVALSSPPGTGVGQLAGRLDVPSILSIHYSDTPGDAVTFTPIPEPNAIMLVVASSWLALQRKRRPRA